VNKLVKTLVLFSLILSTTVFANWTSEERLSAKKVSISEPGFISTAKANCYARGVKKIKTDHLLFREKFESFFTMKPMEFDILIPKNVNSKFQIVHLFPGIFGNTDDGIMYIFIEQILAAGNIVSVYPNPLSKQYFKSVPRKISAGNLEEEADFFKHVVLESEKRIKSKTPNMTKEKSRFLGLSYGAFISSIVSAKIEQTHPGFVSELVLFSPPLEMKTALASIDQSLKKMESEFSHFPVVYGGLKMWQVCNSKLTDYKSYKHVAKKMVLHLGFLESLSNSLVTYMKNRGEWHFWWYPFRLMTTNYFKWKKTLRFSKVINDFKLTRTKIFLSSEKAKIDYWLNLLLKNPNAKLKIYSAKDDFLNTNNSWEGTKIPKKSLILREKGGHLGFLDRLEFIDLLNQIYH
jgi:hypothetical protein